jgi:hypothetical protein
VFRTHDEREQRLVAVKAFTLDITPERAEELSEHLQQVVEIDLEHPHIARPIATGVEDSVAYLAQQYVTGESLDAAIRQYGPAPVNDTARLIGHVAEALDVAAHVGVFHGALNPRDILVTPGETHITGLGVSMALERIGQHGPIRRPYAAPERESGQEWGAAADVFSLAVIAYEVLTGRRALPGTEQPVPGLADLQVRDAAALREILEAAIDPEPERRPSNAREFASALASALVDAGTVRAPAERGGGSRRKIKPRAPKLPGLDDPLIPQETQTVAPPTPVGGNEPVLVPPPAPASAGELPPESGANLAAPVEPSEAHDTDLAQPATPGVPSEALDTDLVAPSEAPAAPFEAHDTNLAQPAAPAVPSEAYDEEREPSPAVEGVMPAAPIEFRHEPLIDWYGADAGFDLGFDDAVRVAPAAPTVPSEAYDEEREPSPAVEVVMPAAPIEFRHEPLIDWYGADAGFDLGFDDAVRVAPDVIAPDLIAADQIAPDVIVPDVIAADPAVPLAAEPFELPDLRIRPTPHPDEMAWAGPTLDVVSPRAEPHHTDAALSPSLFDSEPAESPVTLPRSLGAGSSVDGTRDSKPRAFDSSVPRAIDRTRGAGSVSRPSPRFEPRRASEKDRSYALTAMAFAAGVLLGLLAGYEIGARWGQSTPATAVATQPAPAGETAARPAAVDPVTPPVASPAPATRGSAVPPPPATRAPVASPAPARNARAVAPSGVAPRAGAPTTAGGTAPAKAAPPSAVTEGRINVRTVPPGAGLSLDGERAGTAPQPFRNLPLGTHVVRAALPGYVAQERKVTLTAARPAMLLDITLPKAAGRKPPPAPASETAAEAAQSSPITFVSRPPGARVILDGKGVGITPLTLNRVAPGRHTIELRLAGYRPWTSPITVDAGKPQRVTGSLERDISR